MKISRRDFLRSAGTVVLIGGSVPLLNGCTGLKRADVKQNDAMVTGLKQDEMHILELASLAPSGHNTQPWAVRSIEPYTWIIISDEQRWLPAVDPYQRETLLSIGAFIENLVVAAGCYGYNVDLKLLAKKLNDKEIAEVKLSKPGGHFTKNDGVERIKHRRVVRKGYLSNELGENDLRCLINVDSERIHYFSPSSMAGRYLSEGTVEANRQQAYRDTAQEELSKWIRWPNDDAISSRDGLTPEGMEITGMAGWYVRHFFGREDVMKNAFRETTVNVVKEQVSCHGGWLVITSKDETVAGLLETGRLFQQMFLGCREKMIAIHPMTQMLEEEPWTHEVANELGLGAPVQFILRAGYIKAYPDPVTLRRPVNWFVTP